MNHFLNVETYLKSFNLHFQLSLSNYLSFWFTLLDEETEMNSIKQIIVLFSSIFFSSNPINIFLLRSKLKGRRLVHILLETILLKGFKTLNFSKMCVTNRERNKFQRRNSQNFLSKIPKIFETASCFYIAVSWNRALINQFNCSYYQYVVISTLKNVLIAKNQVILRLKVTKS